MLTIYDSFNSFIWFLGLGVLYDVNHVFSPTVQRTLLQDGSTFASQWPSCDPGQGQEEWSQEEASI